QEQRNGRLHPARGRARRSRSSGPRAVGDVRRAIVTAIGAVSPAAVAIVAPVAMAFAARYRIHPVMMGMMVVQGATAGSFSPIGIFGSITNGVVAGNDLPSNPTFLFFSAFIAATVIAVITYIVFGGRRLLARGQVVESRPRSVARQETPDTRRHARLGRA